MTRTIKLLLAVFIAVSFSACKKSNPIEDDFDLFGAGNFTMEVDGATWKASASTVITVPPQEDGEDYYGVSITATSGDLEGNKPVDVFTIVLALNESKFNQAKGTYTLNPSVDLGSGINEAYANYITLINEETGISGVYHPTSGTLKISDYKIKEQSYAGHLYGKGISEISGTVEGTFVLTDADHAAADIKKTIVIKNGKFKVKNLLNSF